MDSSLNNIVRNNTLSPARVANALDAGLTEVNRAFVEEMIFDKEEIEYTSYTQTGDITFEIGAGNLVDRYSAARMRITSDGESTINFGDGFDFIYGITNGEILDAGTYEFYFLYLNGSVTVNVPGVTSQSSSLVQLSAPAGFTATADGENEIDLSWSDVSNESSYLIEWSLTGSGGWTTLSEPVADATTANHTGLASGDTRHYRIKAVGDGVSFTDSAYATASATTEDPADLDAPNFTFLPANGATDHPINKEIVITSDEALLKTDGTEITDANVAALLILKETNGAGANIAFTATIDVTKTIITITPTTHYGDNQVVYVAINNVEDASGNEITVAESVTFTTTEYTYFDGNHAIRFGDILDSVITAANTNFELHLTVNDVSWSGTRYIVTKYSTPDNQRSFNWRASGNNVIFQWVGNVNGENARQVTWTNVLTAGEHDLKLTYDGSIDTNDGLDRVALYIDTVLQGSKALTSSNESLLETIANGTAQLAIGALVNATGVDPTGPKIIGQFKDFLFKSTSGSVTEINLPLLKDLEDISGNNRDGIWV
jgi:hypothetical protein